MTDATPSPFLDGYELCRTVADFKRCLEESSLASERAEDYETRPAPDRIAHKKSALRPEQGAILCGISVAWRSPTGQLRSCYVGFRHDPKWTLWQQPDAEEVMQVWRDNCRDLPKTCLRVAHNGLRMERGIDLREGVPFPHPGQGHDTMVAYRVANKGVTHKELIGLKHLRKHHLPHRGYDSTKDELDAWLKAHGYKPGADIWRAPVDLAGEYGAGDTCSTLELWEAIKPLVYRPWRWPDEFGWWWERGHFDLSGGMYGDDVVTPAGENPPGPELADLYDLEIETGYQALLASQRGTRVNMQMATRRTKGAQLLSKACDAWVRAHVIKLQETMGPLGWICKGDDLNKLNPGSVPQIKRLLFGDGMENPGLGMTVDTRFMSKKFQMKSAAEQEAIVSDPVKVREYAQLSIDAMKHYVAAYPAHAALLSIVGARRKMTTVLQWANQTVSNFGVRATTNRWWMEEISTTASSAVSEVHTSASAHACNNDYILDSGNPWDTPLTDRVYHQLGTVNTVSGRFSSSDYNGQNVSADKALRISRAVLSILQAFLPEADFAAMVQWIDFLKDGSADFGVRCLFMADPGHAGRPIDLSQIEVRIFAGLTNNKALCEGYGRPPTAEEVATELRLLRSLGEGQITPEEYLQRCVLDPLRHWRGTPIDAHSLVTSMTTDDADVHRFALSRAEFDDVLQLCANDEDRAILKMAQARAVFRGETTVTVDARSISRDELKTCIAALSELERGNVATFIKELVAARKSKKGITFGIMYGMGVSKLARSLGMTLDEAKDFLNNKYYLKLPEAKTLPDRIGRQIVQRATVENNYVGWMRHPAGRRFSFDVVWTHKYKKGDCPTRAVGKKPGPKVHPCQECILEAKGAYVAPNRFIQGYAAAVYKLGFVRTGQVLTLPYFGGTRVDPITRRRYGHSWIDRSIHDETVYMLSHCIDNPVTDYVLRCLMTLMTRVGVPLETSSERFVTNWGEKEEVKYSSFEG